MKKYLLFLVVFFVSGSVLTAQKKDTNPIPVIFDTDIGNDIDDVLALQMLINYDRSKVINLLGVTIGKSYPRVVEYLDGYLRYQKFRPLPIGFAYNGVNPEPYRYVPIALDTLVHDKPILKPKRKLDSSIPEGYKLQRKLLAKAKDGSVVFIAVGPLTNLQRLLDSEPDEYSPLNGTELVKRKVRLLSVMAGLYNDEFDFPEWNVVQDLHASKVVFERWPTLLVASGFEVGSKLLYPHQSILNDFPHKGSNPLTISYEVYQKMPYDRQTWDLTSVLHAVEPDQAYFDLSAAGKITIEKEGHSHFSARSDQSHHYLIIPQEKQARTLARLVELVTGKK